MNKKDKKRTPKQIAALLCVVVLACIYLATLVVAFLDFPGSDKFFSACLLATIGLPILLWIYIWLYGVTKERRTIASIDFLEGDEVEKNVANYDNIKKNVESDDVETAIKSDDAQSSDMEAAAKSDNAKSSDKPDI